MDRSLGYAATGALFESIFRGTGALAHNAAYSIACMAKTGGQSIHKNVKQNQALLAFRQQALIENPEPLLLEDVVAEQCESDSVEVISEAIELYDAEKYSEAQKALTTLITAQPTNPELFYWNGMTLYALEKFPEAKAEFQKGVKAKSSSDLKCFMEHFTIFVTCGTSNSRNRSKYSAYLRYAKFYR